LSAETRISVNATTAVPCLTQEQRMERVEAAHRYGVPVQRGFVFITDTANWSRFWPGYVRLEEGSRWGTAGDTARLVTRLLGRERELTMTITAFEPNRLVAYTSTQPGLPDASHVRHFERDGDGFHLPAHRRVRAARRDRRPVRPFPARSENPRRDPAHVRGPGAGVRHFRRLASRRTPRRRLRDIGHLDPHVAA
jgi:hypothetical protein